MEGGREIERQHAAPSPFCAAGVPARTWPALTPAPLLPPSLLPRPLQLGAGVDPAWGAQRSARTAATEDDASASDLGSDEYSPRSSNASPSARRWVPARGRAGRGCERTRGVCVLRGPVMAGGAGNPLLRLPTRGGKNRGGKKRGLTLVPAPLPPAMQHPAPRQPPHLALSRQPLAAAPPQRADV